MLSMTTHRTYTKSISGKVRKSKERREARERCKGAVLPNTHKLPPALPQSLQTVSFQPRLTQPTVNLDTMTVSSVTVSSIRARAGEWGVQEVWTVGVGIRRDGCGIANTYASGSEIHLLTISCSY